MTSSAVATSMTPSIVAGPAGRWPADTLTARAHCRGSDFRVTVALGRHLYPRAAIAGVRLRLGEHSRRTRVYAVAHRVTVLTAVKHLHRLAT